MSVRSGSKREDSSILGSSFRALTGILTTLFVVAAPGLARGDELVQGWVSARAAGMGNAYAAVTSGSDALLYNPAALCRVSGIHWTLADPSIGINGMETITLAQKLLTAYKDIPGTLPELYGKKVWYGAFGKSAVTIPCLGAGLYVSSQLGFFAENRPNPVLHLNSYGDVGAVAGFGIPIIPSVMSIGLALRRVTRTGAGSIGVGMLAAGDSTALQSEFNKKGVAFALDIGADIRIPGPISPSLSLVYRDLGDTKFTAATGASAPPTTKGELLIGGAFEIDTPLISITPAFDYRYIGRAEVQTGKKINFGVEVDLPLLAARAGFHQGYYTIGAGLDLGVMELDVATWGVELGEYPGQHEDRRYMATLKLQLGIDPSFFGFGGFGGGSGGSDGASGKGGPRRRLKQRR